MPNFKEKLRGKDKLETLENYSILFIFLGGIILSFGIGSTIITPRGWPVILAMLGSLIAFLSTLALILIWLIREFKGE